MDPAKTTPKITAARHEYGSGELIHFNNKVNPVKRKEQSIIKVNLANKVTIADGARAVSPKTISLNPSSFGTLDHNHDVINSKSLSSADRLKAVSAWTKKIPSSIEPQNSSGCCIIDWFKSLLFKEKITFWIILSVIIIAIVVTVVIPPVYLYLIRQTPIQSSFTNLTASVCSTATCIGKETEYHSSIATALYPFDGNPNDLAGYYSGTSYGTPLASYISTGYINQAIWYTSGGQQYILIPNVDLTKKSFTLQAWLYNTGITGANTLGIFGQCDANGNCLSLSIQNGRVTFSFDYMNATSKVLSGASILSNSVWLHIAAVYDVTLFQQQVYVDGQLDGRSYGIVNPFQGVAFGSITTIGRSSSNASGLTYYLGVIDHFIISAGTARNACQIYNDASLITYYPFDTAASYNDYSVYYCNGVASGTTIVPGRVNQAISFTSSTSYFQSQCFPRLRGLDPSFSFSFWINPTSVLGGTLVHSSSNMYGNGSCYDPLVFTSNGSLVCQWRTTTPTINNMQGPMISTNTWTHVAAVYSSKNGVRLFINGQSVVSTPYGTPMTLDYATVPWYITLGNRGPLGTSSLPNCLNGSIPISPGPFTGIIDEFRLYNRELEMEEICMLADL